MKEILYTRNGKLYKIYKLVDKQTNVIFYEAGKPENKFILSYEDFTENYQLYKEPKEEPLGFWESRARVKELCEMDNKPYEEVHGSY